MCSRMDVDLSVRDRERGGKIRNGAKCGSFNKITI